MKRNIFAIALCAIFAFGCLTSCKTELTDEEILTTKKGWKLVAATTEPDYLLNEGEVNEVPIKDLFNDGYVSSCEKDDILYFDVNGAVTLNFGKDKKTFPCDDVQANTEKALDGKWDLSEDGKTLSTPLPWSEGKLIATVLTLEEKTLKLKFPVSFGDDDAVTHYFTVTYNRN